ncbi:DMT family transporter [Pseudoprimorskyibacter insulae]|uniref:Riboflavin transporter n=1 Tax=Pseudoprimorskyibacter insulae TaxID=1695997 RepID=A0A2R8AWM0_9RHOB|nr:DMT family transporter [Pseudoprimorskyibacter insulae]SPF80436.1 Riboflavin transporter [Pseudoprimorskyibacter insulae]
MNDTLKACLWMIGAVLSFTSMAIAGRAVSYNLDTFEIMMYRSFIGVTIVFALAKATGTFHHIRPNKMGLHTIRNISHFTGQNLWFYSITVLPLAQVFALEFTMPLWVMVMAPFVLGEALTRSRAVAALIGFIGILIVTRPDPSTFSFGMITAACAAIGFAGSAVFTRRLTRTEHTVSILFFLTAMQSVFGLVCAGFDGDIALPTAQNIPWIIVISLAGLTAHFCLTTALGLAPAAVIVPVDFARLPIIAIVGMVLYDEGIDIYVLIGALIIFGANYFNILRETRLRREAGA